MEVPETLPLAVAAGVAAGAVHVLTGPDHLAAVLPFASAARRRAVAIGLAWGIGHSLGVLALGAIALALEGLLDPAGASLGAERLVGFLLIGLGLWTLRRARWVVVHAHPHAHPQAHLEGSGASGAGGDPRAPRPRAPHAHAHVHIGDRTVGDADHPERGAHGRHRHSALAFGVVHGVAGTSHLLGVAPALMLETPAAVGYLGAFLVGSALAMGLFAAAAGHLVGASARRMRLGLLASGTFAIAVGGIWVVQSFA